MNEQMSVLLGDTLHLTIHTREGMHFTIFMTTFIFF